MKRLHQEWGDRVHFVDVLVRQGHPGPEAPPYRSMDQKLADAARYVREESVPWLVAVDDLPGTVHTRYGLLADPTYLIDRDGCVAFHDFWTHVPTLHAAIERLLDQGGVGVVGEARLPHPLAALAGGWRAIERGLPQSYEDLERAMPGSGTALWLGSYAGPVLAPVAFSSRPWSAQTKATIAAGVAAGLVGVLLARRIRPRSALR